jgi:Protein of unknown function (DUF2591)
MKTSEANGEVLNYLVAKCEGMLEVIHDTTSEELWYYDREAGSDKHFWPTTDWSQAGPIIERERIGFRFSGDFGFCAWKSYGIGSHQNEHSQYGPTPLVAAMRCYVASKLGDEVEIPKELAEVNA